MFQIYHLQCLKIRKRRLREEVRARRAAGAGEVGPEHRVGAQLRSEGAVEADAGAGWGGADGQQEEETAAARLGGVVSTELVKRV